MIIFFPNTLEDIKRQYEESLALAKEEYNNMETLRAIYDDFDCEEDVQYNKEETLEKLKESTYMMLYFAGQLKQNAEVYRVNLEKAIAKETSGDLKTEYEAELSKAKMECTVAMDYKNHVDTILSEYGFEPQREA